MRVVLDTNILVSALLSPFGYPAIIYRSWHDGQFTLVTCKEQIDELRATLHKPYLTERIKPHQAGRLINDVREQAEVIDSLPHVRRSPDSTDDFLLALCEAGIADYLVTGDKCGLLLLISHMSARIISASNFGASFERVSKAGGSGYN